jgi:hypothetical protein
MNSAQQTVFISHASADDALVKQLREALEAQRIPVWADSRELVGGNLLDPAIARAIDDSCHFLVVLGPLTQNSRWVRKEIQRRAGGSPDARGRWPGLPADPASAARHRVRQRSACGSTMSRSLSRSASTAGRRASKRPCRKSSAALGRQLPNDFEPPQAHETTPIADLILELSEPAIVEASDGDGRASKRRATARAVLIYDPPAADAPQSRSKAFRFTAPLGAIEAGDLA